MPTAMYIHIPFCEHICYYCDFNKFFIQNQPVDDYIEALNKEINENISRTHPPFQSIYIGGGTPTALSANQLEKLLTNVFERISVHPEQLEFTVEMNPGDADKNKLKLLRDFGVNRLSIGVQSFHDDMLKKIGRGHTASDARKTVSFAQETGFKNISIDLMYGLPGQTMTMWQETISEALQLEVQHMSAYSLLLETNTMFYNWYRKGELQLLSEDTEADMYEYLVEKLSVHGYEAYELSNFAKPGFESRHNQTYWKNNHYYGFGAGAHGYVNGIRYENIKPLPHYIEALKKNESPIKEQHQVTKKEMMEEEMFMGLRMSKGVSQKLFYEKYQEKMEEIFGKQINRLLEERLVEWKDDSLSLTPKGKLLANEVFEAFLL
ncbi:radical SAM family heme chaperone HemW [Aliibacillus thermotolerans]|uniref:Heme chaperone HemW n=1 Tax=Aliibacillus thermotolerans TaxID=1834418 RepID=A0ABW0U8E1_9BACI|nr:radical SAM family heme chaperone HemW [Aliibacillus thermotolerans]MDA3130755.1 oxygen-independent coproporphyrinogen III oxidase [Aliibacillus thermotolerans]